MVGKAIVKKRKWGRTSKEGIKSSSTESITTATWLNAIFARPLKAVHQTYRDFRQWITAEFLCAIAVVVLQLLRLFLSPSPSTVTRYILSSMSFFFGKQTLFPQRPASRIISHASAKRIDTCWKTLLLSISFNPEIIIESHKWRSYRCWSGLCSEKSDENKYRRTGIAKDY